MNQPAQKFNPTTVLIISITAFLIPLAIMVGNVLQHTRGVFAYPLDDTYIHLAVAKNLTLNNVWGVSGHEFASASSSILYPLLLSAIFKITGVQTIVPFILNLATGLIFIVVLQRWLSRQGINTNGQLIALLLTIFLVPLPGIVMIGMEHTLHLLFFFLFLTSFVEAIEGLSSSTSARMTLPSKVYLYGALMMATRFESFILLGAACGIPFFYRHWMLAIKLGFISFLPVILFGIISLSKGGFFLPNAVMLKPALPPLTVDGIIDYLQYEYLPRLFTASERYNTLGVQRLLLLLPLTLLLYWRSMREKIAYRYALLMLIVCSFFHIILTAYSIYARYEAYIIGSTVAVCSLLIIKYGQIQLDETSPVPQWTTWLLALFLAVPLLTRGWSILDQVPQGSIWTNDQQVQMGQFVHKYYDSAGVVFNDIGAVSYFSEGKKVDILGLGNNDIARLRRQHLNTPDLLDRVDSERSMKIAITYEPRFKSYAKRWRKVSSWFIPYDNPIGLYDSVTFYAVDTLEAPALMDKLKKYQPLMPKEIVVRYYDDHQ